MNIGFDAKRAFNNLTGLGNYSRSVIQSIANQSDYNLYLFTTNQTKQFNPKGDKIHTIKPSKWTNKRYWRYIGINEDIKKFHIDIYHGLSNDMIWNKKVKRIVTIHDLLFLKYPQFYNPIDRIIYRIKSKKACLEADKIIAISKQTKEDIIYYYNIPEDKIEVVYQTCHNDFIDNNHPNHLIDKYKLEKPFLLYIGTIEERKNLLFLLKAINEIKEIQLVCIGKKTKYYSKVQNYIKKNNLNNKVRFIEITNNKELSLIYQKSRGVVYPSIDEGFGIPIIEAMYSSKPIITSNKKIFKEVAGIQSYYFEENNIDSLITQINNIWTSSKDRDDRIIKNMEYVKKFTEQKQAQKIISIYNKLNNG